MALATGQITINNIEETISVVFSKDNHVFPGGVSSALAGSVDISVKAYIGAEEVSYTFGSVTPAAPTGLTIAPSSTNKKITLTATTSLKQASGTYNVQVVVRGVTITKTLSYVIGFKGATGSQGPKGDTGTSVDSVTEHYLATSAATGVTTSTSGWTTTMQPMTTTKKYLWNYETINFSDGSSAPTIPVIIGVYGNTGDTGETGATGRSLTGVTEYYLASASSSGVTRSTSGWTTAMQTTDPTKKYLWNYEKLTWSSGTTTTYVDPIIIGIHGEKGDTGDKGPDGYTVILTNESHIFPGLESKAVAGSSVTSNIIVYKGPTQIASSVAVTGAPTGMTVTVAGNASKSNSFTAAIHATTAMTTMNGELTVTVTADGKTFPKKFSFAVAKKGANGTDARLVRIIPSALDFVTNTVSANPASYVYAPSSIALTPTFQSCTYSKWQYSTNGSTWTNVTTQNGLSINSTSKVLTVSSSSTLFSPTQSFLVFKCESSTGEADVVMLNRVFDSGALGGRLTTAEINLSEQAGEIALRATKEELQALNNLIPDPYENGGVLGGWSGSGLTVSNVDFLGSTIPVLQSRTATNIQNYSPYFKVDPRKAYEISFWAKSEQPAPTSTSFYFGLNAINASSATLGVIPITKAAGVVESLNSNFYFATIAGAGALTEWTKFVGYILPAGTTGEEGKGLGSSDVARNASMTSGHDRIRIRFLNWSNTTTRSVWVARPTVKEVPSGMATDFSRRVSSAELKVTPSAITSTVRSSQDYINDQGKKVSTNEIISKINQSAEAITIDATKININGAVTFSSFDTTLKNNLNQRARTFTTTPTTPYSLGDIWKSGTSTYMCKVARATGSYVASDWEKTGDVTSANTAADTSKVNGTAASTVKAGAAAGTAAKTRTDDWTYTGQTTINGGKIQADTITAAQIKANTITANKLASDVGSSLDLSSNTSITLKVQNQIQNAISEADLVTNTELAGAITAQLQPLQQAVNDNEAAIGDVEAAISEKDARTLKSLMDTLGVSYSALTAQAEEFTENENVGPLLTTNNTKYNLMVGVYNSAIADGEITEQEWTNFDAAVTAYKASSADLERELVSVLNTGIGNLQSELTTVQQNITGDSIIQRITTTQTWTDAFSEIPDVDEIGNLIDSKIVTYDTLQTQLDDEFRREITKSISDNTELIDSKTRYFSETMDGLEIGLSGSPFTTLIAHDKISFKNGLDTVSYIRHNQQVIENVITKTSIQIGEHKFESYPGNLTIARWVGPFVE